MAHLDGQSSRSTLGRDPLTGQYARGHMGAYRTRRMLIEERLIALQSQYKADNPADLALLSLAAIHLVDAEKARARTNRVRACNSAMKILKAIPRKEPTQTLDQLLGVR